MEKGSSLIATQNRCLNTMSAQYQTIISKSMEQSFVNCIQQTVKVLAENYEFDYEDALALFGLDDLKVTTTMGKTKGIATVGSAPKHTKPKYPLPFDGEIVDDCCRAIVFNSGLFTQCLKAPKPESQKLLCQTCEKQAEKTPLGNPPLGYISERVDRGDDWADPKGRRPVSYTKVMKVKKFTQEEVMAQVSIANKNIDLKIFDDADNEKRGRKKGGKKTEVQSIFGDDDEDDGALGALIQEVKDGGSETSEKSKTSKTSSKKSKEERETEKQEKASQKSETDMMKAEEKRMKEIRKEEEKAAKEHEKKVKEQQKEAIKALKETKEEEKRIAKAEKEAAKAAKEAAKAEKEAAKAAKEVSKADEKRAPIKKISEEKNQPLKPVPLEETQVLPPLEEPKDLPPFEEVQDLPPLEEVEEVEEVPRSPLSPPPMEDIKMPVVESKKPKKSWAGKFKGQDGISYVWDQNKIVYRKDNPTVRVGVVTDSGFEMDDPQEEEEEEDLSDEDD